MEPSRSATGALPDRSLIDDVIVDAGQRRLWRGQQPLAVTRQTFKLLLTLMEGAPNLVTHDEIIARVWGSRRVVSPETLAQCVLRLRQALGDEASAPRYIESIRGNGYRLIPPIQSVEGAGQEQVRVPGADRRAPARMTRSISGVATLCLLVALGAMALGRMTGDPDVAAGSLSDLPSTPAVPPRSLAILPIDGSGTDAPDPAVADGFHADILSELARIRDLSVIARATMRRYADTELSIADIARELNVESVMQIELIRSGQRLELTAELIDGRSGAQQWFSRYDEHPDMLYTLQRELTADIAEALSARLSDAELARLQARPTTSAEAYELFLTAVDSFSLDFTDRAMVARSLLDKAIALDGEFAAAYGLKALIYAYLIDSFTDPSENFRAVQAERARLARELATRALEIDGGTVVAHRALAIAASYSWRFEEARRAFETTLEQSPNDVNALAEFAYFSVCSLGDHAGLRYVERGLELDPRNPRMHEMYGRSLNCVGRSEAALAELRHAVQLNGAVFHYRGMSAYIAARLLPVEEAVQELRDLQPLLRDTLLLSYPPIALSFRQLGYRADARRLIARFEELNGFATANPGTLVFAYLALDDDEAAYRTLEQAVDELGPGSGYLTLLAIRRNTRGVPELNEPRFVQLRERIRSLD
jgi:TolB-like protein/DNA-binding winged helix-turn-helix (wHTH) protein